MNIIFQNVLASLIPFYIKKKKSIFVYIITICEIDNLSNMTYINIFIPIFYIIGKQKCDQSKVLECNALFRAVSLIQSFYMVHFRTKSHKYSSRRKHKIASKFIAVHTMRLFIKYR